MKISVIVLFTSVFSLSALAGAGGSGVRNGGSGAYCGGAGLEVIDSLYARRWTDLSKVPSDRNEFFEMIKSRLQSTPVWKEIENALVKNGDSDSWPLLPLPVTDTYYYSITPGWIPLPTAYSPEGKIPAVNPTDSICSYPAYDPEICCERVIVASFLPEEGFSRRHPTRQTALTRKQKNILELHEAIYIAARAIGRKGSELPDLKRYPEIARYIQHPRFKGELPVTLVEMFTSQLLTERPGESSSQDLIEVIDNFSRWSSVVYRKSSINKGT